MKIYVYAEWNEWGNLVDYHGLDHESSLYGQLIHETEIEHPNCSNEDAINYAVQQLREKKAKVRADAEKECMEIDAKLQSLIALPAAAL